MKPGIIEKEAGTLPGRAPPRTQPGVVPHAPQPACDPEMFSVRGRILCGIIAAAFALGVYLAPNMPALFFVYAIFAFGVFVFGQIAVFGRFGRKPEVR